MPDTAFISTGEPVTGISAFLDPRGSNLHAVRESLHQVVDLVTGHLSQADQLCTVPFDWDRIKTSNLLPEHPASEQELLDSYKKLLDGSMNPAHPRYLGHMDPLPSTSSVVASLITAAVNNNLLSREMAPIFSDLEQRLLQELAGLFGLPVATAGGVMQSGGSLCNLQAIAVARNAKLGCHTTGLVGLKKQPIIFASELCHSSIQKAAMLLGLGTQGVVTIPTDARCKMCPDALRSAIELAHQNGQQPFAVVATAGTTVTGSIDPLPEIATLCKEYDLWYHVDASYGGAIIFSDEKRPLLNGIEQADSITFNPQKWCYVTKACALVMFRDVQVLDRYFRIEAPYMNMHEGTGETNLGEWGIQGTRAPDIAKWWLTLMQLGKSGLSSLIDAGYESTSRFLGHLQKRDYLELATQPEMNILCFRDCRKKSEQSSLAQQNEQLQQHLLKHSDTFFSLPMFRESRWLKAVLLNPFTTEEDFQQIFTEIDRFGA